MEDGHAMNLEENIYANTELANRIKVEKLAAIVKGMAASNGFKKEFDVSVVCLDNVLINYYKWGCLSYQLCQVSKHI